MLSIFQATYNGVLNNVAPSFQISEPNGLADNADMSFTLSWTDSDPDDDARITLYRDTNDSGFDGVPIEECSNMSENSATDSCNFDTRGLPAGSYYIYGCISDQINAQSATTAAGL